MLRAKILNGWQTGRVLSGRRGDSAASTDGRGTWTSRVAAVTAATDLSQRESGGDRPLASYPYQSRAGPPRETSVRPGDATLIPRRMLIRHLSYFILHSDPPRGVNCEGLPFGAAPGRYSRNGRACVGNGRYFATKSRRSIGIRFGIRVMVSSRARRATPPEP